MSSEHTSLRRQIDNIKANLRLIAERKSQFVSETAIDLQLLSDEQQLHAQVTALEDQLLTLGVNNATNRADSDALLLPATDCPYRGLEAFEAKHAVNYFGRDDMIAKLVAKVGGANFVAVVGPSGSGKSSLVRAGLVTALKGRGALLGSREWEIAIIRPLDDPLRSLAQLLVDQLAQELTPIKRIEEIRTLTDGLQSGKIPIGDVLAALRQKPGYPPRLVIIIDQFEETFTLTGESDAAKAARRTFLNTLLNASETPWLTIVFTLRADFYGHILADERFGKRVDAGLVNVLSMTLTERREAIEKPALAAGRRFEEGLVVRILDDLEQEAGNLPLLEFALTELWERATPEGSLTHAAYEAIGEVAGAIAKRAEQTLRSLKPDEQQMVRRIFTRLVRVTQPEENAEDTKRRIALHELEATYQPLVQKLADARLLVTGRDEQSGAETVEVAHEALIRNWQELQSWLNSDREFLLWRQRLRTRVADWIASSKDKDDLLRGVQLSESEGWSHARSQDLSSQERDFILVSRQQVDQEAKAEEERRQRELQLIEARAEAERQRAETQTQAATALRRRALWLAGALVVALLAAGVAYLYYAQADLALTNEANARQAEVNARQTAEAGSATLALEVATRTAAEANAKQATESEATQRTAAEQQSRLAQARYLANQAAFYRNTDPQLALLLARAAVSTTNAVDGYTTVEANAALRGLLQPTYTSQPTWTGHTGDVSAVAFSPDGKTLASGGGDNTVILWEVSSGKPLTTLNQHTGAVFSIAFSPDGTILASGSQDTLVILWEVSSGKPLARLKHTGAVNAIAFGPDGTTLASGSSDNSVIVWNVSNGKPLITLNQHTNIVRSVAFSPDGTTLASGSFDKSVILWEVSSGKPLTTLNRHTHVVLSVTFSPDGTTLASGDGDGSVILWEVSGGKPLITLNQHTGAVNSVDFSSDTTLASGSNDNSVILWEVSSGKPLITLNRYTKTVYAIAFSPDGTTLASGGSDNSVMLWEVSSGLPLATFTQHMDSVTSVAFSSDSKTLASGSWDHTVILWEVSSGQPLATFKQHTESVYTVAFSPDGKTLASGSGDGTVILWEVSSGQILATFKQHTESVSSVAFSPDGKTLVSGSRDDTVILWEVSSGQPLVTLKQHTESVSSVAFSPDGKTLASGSDDNTVILWEVSSGQPLVILKQHTDYVRSVAFSPDGKTLASGSDDNTVILWEVSSGQPLATLKQHTNLVFAVAFSPDGKTLASGSADDSVIFFGSEPEPDRIVLTRYIGPVWHANFNPQGDRVASAGVDGIVHLWDAINGKAEVELRGHGSITSTAADCPACIQTITFDPTGARLLSAGWDGTVRLWDLEQKHALTLTAHTGRLLDAQFSPNGAMFATSAEDERILLWDTQKVTVTQVITGVFANQVNFSPDSQFLVVASSTGVLLVETYSGKKVLEGQDQQGLLSAVFSPDGQQFATAGFEGVATLWSVATGEKSAILRGHTKAIYTIVYSKQGDLVATASDDGTARVWDAKTGAVRFVLQGHTDGVRNVAFRPDGRQLATAGIDGTMRLWNLQTGGVEAILPDAKGVENLVSWGIEDVQKGVISSSDPLDLKSILDVNYDATGERVVAASLDGTVTIYVASVESLLNIASSQLIRDFTCQERVQFLSETLECQTDAQSKTNDNP